MRAFIVEGVGVVWRRPLPRARGFAAPARNRTDTDAAGQAGMRKYEGNAHQLTTLLTVDATTSLKRRNENVCSTVSRPRAAMALRSEGH
jgi:hypothetical protein